MNRSTLQGTRSRGGRGRGGHGGQCRGRNGGEKDDKSDDTKDGNGKVGSSHTIVKCKRCGDDRQKAVRCLGQLRGICGGKGHPAEICANVSVLACHRSC